MTLDTAIDLETPEGTEIEIRPAGPCVRSLAFVIDELLRWLIIAGGFTLTGFLGVLGEGLALIVFFVSYWLYGVVFEVLNNGQTPGKKAQGLQVVHDDGTPVQLPASLLRNLLLFVDLLPVFYVAGLVSMTLSQRFQRLGDLAAGTLVIHQPVPVAGSAATTSVQPGAIAPPLLLQEEQAVIVDFLEREETLTDDRRRELATLAGAALGVDEDSAPAEVRHLAQVLRGG